jgi:predicted Zn-dependent protease
MKKTVVMFLALAVVGCVSESSLRVEANQQFQQMRRQIPVSRNPAERAYIFCVAQSVLRVVEEPYASQAWEIEVFDMPDANAFAMPGGKIGVYSGLLDVARDQDQLAAVIGHEVAHVTREHQVQQVNRGMVTQGAAAVVGASVGMQQTARMAAELGLTLPFSRKHESEADDVGLLYMADAGFDPRASVTLWKNMEEKSGGARPPLFLSTHPAPEDRMSDLISLMSDALERYNAALDRGIRPVCE